MQLRSMERSFLVSFQLHRQFAGDHPSFAEQVAAKIVALAELFAHTELLVVDTDSVAELLQAAYIEPAEYIQ